jgi:hypothetical protein
MTITFDEFKSVVSANWRSPEENGPFEVVQGLAVERTLYQWQNRRHFGAVSYDTDDNPQPWYVDNGRGAGGRGATYEEADKAERASYDRGFALQMSRS